MSAFGTKQTFKEIPLESIIHACALIVERVGKSGQTENHISISKYFTDNKE
jgi:hypothetical protein